MTKRPLSTACLVLCLAARAWSADAPAPLPAPESEKTDIKEILKARAAAEAAKAKAAKPTAVAPVNPAAAKPTSANINAAPTTATAPMASKDAASAPAANSPEAAKAKEETATMLPQVDVKKDPIEVIEQQAKIYQVEKDILVEKRKTKPTEVDKALNDSKVSKVLSVFGGESSSYRANIAKERVSLMEEEKDLMEALTHAKTKEEKQELQKQIDAIKSLRRDLEKSMR